MKLVNTLNLTAICSTYLKVYSPSHLFFFSNKKNCLLICIQIVLFLSRLVKLNKMAGVKQGCCFGLDEEK